MLAETELECTHFVILVHVFPSICFPSLQFHIFFFISSFKAFTSHARYISSIHILASHLSFLQSFLYLSIVMSINFPFKSYKLNQVFVMKLVSFCFTVYSTCTDINTDLKFIISIIFFKNLPKLNCTSCHEYASQSETLYNRLLIKTIGSAGVSLLY